MSVAANPGTNDVPGQELVTPVQIEALCAGRDTAIDHWVAAYEGFHRHTEAAAKACGASIGLPLGRGYGYDDEKLTEEFVKGGKPEKFSEMITKAIDTRCWDSLAKKLNAEALMDRQAKEEFRASLKDPQPFTVDNCRSTFGHMWENRRMMFLRGVANTFSRLDRRFRSHNGFKIGARLVLEGVFETKGWSKPYLRSYERRDTFEDIERIFYEIEGLPVPEHYASTFSGISKLSCDELPTVVQGKYFRVRVFKNGNLHIWFENDELLLQVNRLLGEYYYGSAVGDAYDTTEADDTPEYHITPAKNFGEFFTSPEIADKVLNWGSVHNCRVLEPSAGSGVLAKAARQHGAASVTCFEIQPGLAHELKRLHGFDEVYNYDFLKACPGNFEPFDAIVMNPPFDRGRDCDHVRHAWQFLKPGGQLIAIMSARAEFGEDARHRALHKLIEKEADPGHGRTPWWDLPAGSFAHAGTNVNTVALILRKKKG